MTVQFLFEKIHELVKKYIVQIINLYGKSISTDGENNKKNLIGICYYGSFILSSIGMALYIKILATTNGHCRVTTMAFNTFIFRPNGKNLINNNYTFINRTKSISLERIRKTENRVDS